MKKLSLLLAVIIALGCACAAYAEPDADSMARWTNMLNVLRNGGKSTGKASTVNDDDFSSDGTAKSVRGSENPSPTEAPSSATYKSGDYVYRLNSDDTAEIVEYTGRASTLIIPAELDGHSVSAIGIVAFYNCDFLKSITLPEGLTTIGKKAFYNCNHLSSVEIPDGVTTIGDSAFYGCNSLSSITIPNNLTSIGYQAFFNCNSLNSIILPYGMISIGDSAFCGCGALNSVTIPSSVTSIGKDAFYRCPKNKLLVESDSYAEQYAKENGIPYKVI